MPQALFYKFTLGFTIPDLCYLLAISESRKFVSREFDVNRPLVQRN